MPKTILDQNENIMAKLGLQDLSEEKRLKMLDQMAELIQKRVMLRIMESLPEADVKTANGLVDNPEKLSEFLGSRVNMADLVLAETERLKNELFLEVSEPTAEDLVSPPEAE
ncbi:hypothetical protein JW899_02155 [Candidatus Uhrbacteria bacterium]|nr:hypothetical protein [Candidatus Uhrbacteria bacterium]